MSDAAHSNRAQAVREDIAFMRAMAEQGANSPLLGGSVLLGVGLIYAAACAAVWAVTNAAPADPYHRTPWIWGGAIAAQVVLVAIIVLRRRHRGVSVASRANVVFGQVWNGVGLAILSCLVSFFLIAWLGHNPGVFAGYPTVILALYGVGWIVTAVSSDKRWTWAVGILSFLFAIAAGVFANSVNLPLFFAVALLLLLAAPGAILLSQARSQP